ncbi:galactose ABC transporter substrate-binding protein [Clostridium sp. ZBS15]|uniref:galactose ABC transporter substrate-binding protein n=1 Tax=Clostridium sp. ZBS15 TaxID=2949969 RepID=UPI00207921D8
MLKKILNISIVVFIIIIIFVNYNKNSIITNSKVELVNPAKVGVLIYKLDDEYTSTIQKNLEEIQKENVGKVEFSFFDANGDQSKQNETIDTVLKNEVDLLLVNLVDTSEKSTQTVIDKIKEKNIPVIIFNREPISKIPVKSYEKAIVLARNPEEAGILQGKILVDLWNTNRSEIDVNKDSIMQYVMLTGERNNLDTIARTKYSIETVNKNGIKTEEIALRVSDWSRKLAEEAVTPLLYQYGNKIEAIIANNDAMAIGAIEALQKQNYNKGDETKKIIVVGVDATPEAQELIKKGFMSGTVFQDPRAEAEALYTLGMNLISGKSAIENTDYEFDDTGVTIRIPYKEYITE